MTLKEVADLIGVKYWRLEYALRTGRIKVRKEYRCQNGRWTRENVIEACRLFGVPVPSETKALAGN
jgi:hypothetical protein